MINLFNDFIDDFGEKGIDTEYELSIINYKPELNYEKGIYYNEIDRNKKNKIKRAKEFSIKNVVDRYEELIKKINSLMKTIEEKKEENKDFLEMKELLNNNKKNKATEYEEKNSTHYEDYYSEFYSMLYKIKKSIENRKNGLKKEHSFYIENEEKSIENWEEAEADYTYLDEKLIENASHTHYDEEEHIESGEKEFYKNKIEEVSKYVERYEKYHTNTADIGYVQLNRVMYMEGIVLEIEDKIKNGFDFFEESEEELFRFINTHNNKNQILSHMIINFEKIKSNVKRIKENHVLYESDKEEFFSKEQYQLYKVETKANQELVDWLYYQPESPNFIVKDFSNYLIDSVKETSEDFQNKNANMLKFYKQENIFFKEWYSGIKEKEKIRSYIKLLKK
jgi:hypothetical protein